MTDRRRRRGAPVSIALALGLLVAADALGGQAAPAEVYAEYRAWITTQPDDVRARYPESYREHLAGLGFDPPLIERRIDLIAREGRTLEVAMWNRVLTADAPRFNTDPNAFLIEMAATRRPGTALDVGMGAGRNALYLAARGWEVTGFDPAAAAVALARERAEARGLSLRALTTGLEDFDFGRDRWDLILLSYVGARTLVDEVVASLRPGGLLVLEAFHRDAMDGRSIGRGVVFASNELLTLFDALRIVRYEDTLARADFGPDEPIRVVRLAAVKSTRD